MLIYNNRQEMIDELASNLRVEYRPYGTWRISSYVGSKWNKEDGYIEKYYDSNNEEDSIGIFDGEKYYPQDFEEWKKEYAQYEIKDYEHYHEEELRELFNEWCKILWSDSGNESNYEPIEERFNRLAENIFDEINDSLTDNFFMGGDDTDKEPRYAVLTDKEKDFIYDTEGIFELAEIGKFEEIQELFRKHQEELEDA